MGIKEFVKTLCETVEECRDNFSPALFQAQGCLTREEEAERAGGVICTVNLTPDGELSAEQTACVCTFCIRAKTSDAKTAGVQ